MSLSVQVAGRTDVGCMRTNNEDNFGYDWRYGIFVVCDGMGGQASGEVASKLAVDTVLEYFRAAGKGRHYPAPLHAFAGVSPRAQALASAIQLANRAVHRLAIEDPRHKGMGSTITAVLVENSLYSIAHVGDSRIYLLRKGVIQQLTGDHSLVAEQVRRGLMTPEQAQNSAIQNIIFRALGSEEDVEPDLSDLQAEPGDTLLLTSDGLTHLVADARILEIVEQASTLNQACEALVQEARSRGGQDNITCLLLRFLEKSWMKNLLGDGPGEGNPKWQDSF
jgi:protein phosphatase